MEGLNQGYDLVGVTMPGVERAIRQQPPHHGPLELVAVARENIIGKDVVQENHGMSMGGQEGVAEISICLIPGMEAIQEDQVKHLAVPMISEEGITGG